MARLYSNLKATSTARYYFALDAAPGIVTPGVGTITLSGPSATMTEPASTTRTPATGVITLLGYSTSGPGLVTPAPVVIAVTPRQPSLQTELTIYPTLAQPVETAEPSYAPSLITEMTVSPTTGTISVQPRAANVTEGGNIAFLQPGRTVITLSGPVPIFGFHPSAGTITLIGYAPTLTTGNNLVIEPGTGTITLYGQEPSLSVPFYWVDDDPAPTATWIDD
jgi:hypothetical protein